MAWEFICDRVYIVLMFQLLLFSSSNNFLMIYMLSLQFLIHLIGAFFLSPLEDTLIIFYCFLCLAKFLIRFSYQVIHCYNYERKVLDLTYFPEPGQPILVRLRTFQFLLIKCPCFIYFIFQRKFFYL